MSNHTLLRGVKNLFLDTSPIIYYVEGPERYFDVVNAIFERIRSGDIHAYTSTITLVECLVQPYRQGNVLLARQFRNVICRGINTTYVPVDRHAESAAQLRARYNVSLADALQLATAIGAGCDAFLTNDRDLQRVNGIRVLVLEDIRAERQLE